VDRVNIGRRAILECPNALLQIGLNLLFMVQRLHSSISEKAKDLEKIRKKGWDLHVYTQVPLGLDGGQDRGCEIRI
jgi:hypothetical protein